VLFRSDVALAKAFAMSVELDPTNVAAARQVLGDPQWERDIP
jgi:hypothetical protein